MNDTLSSPVSLFHGEILLLQLVKLALEIEVLLFLHDPSLFRGSLVLGKQALGLVMDKITKDFEGVLLFNFLPFEKLSNFRDSFSDVLKLSVLVLQLFLDETHSVKSLLHVTVVVLGLVLVRLGELHEIATLTD